MLYCDCIVLSNTENSHYVICYCASVLCAWTCIPVMFCLLNIFPYVYLTMCTGVLIAVLTSILLYVIKYVKASIQICLCIYFLLW